MGKVTHNFTLTPNEIQIRQHNIRNGHDARDCEYAVGVLAAHYEIARGLLVELYGEENAPPPLDAKKTTQKDYEQWGYTISDALLGMSAKLNEIEEELRGRKIINFTKPTPQ